MKDRETVIEALQYMISENCTETQFDYIDDIEAAIALLKEQEAVEPTFKQGEDGIFVWACGLCGAYIYHIYDGIDNAKEYAKYCRQCGRMVKWK